MSATPEIEINEATLEAAAAEAIAAFDAATNLDELQEARRGHLGDKSFISQARQSLGTLPKAERKDAGRLVNMARGKAEKHFALYFQLCRLQILKNLNFLLQNSNSAILSFRL